MTATAIPFRPTFVPLIDTRRARGKHRRPREFASLLLATQQRARGAFTLAAMSAGAVAAAVL
jgi:hypothetical protein